MRSMEGNSTVIVSPVWTFRPPLILAIISLPFVNNRGEIPNTGVYNDSFFT
jgi:hypothetical protein